MKSDQQYPEWQKALREAQARRDEAQRQKEEEARRLEQAAANEQARKDRLNFSAILANLGILRPGEQVSGTLIIKDEVVIEFVKADWWPVSEDAPSQEIRLLFTLRLKMLLPPGVTEEDEARAKLSRMYRPELALRGDLEVANVGSFSSSGWDEVRAEFADFLDALAEDMNEWARKLVQSRIPMTPHPGGLTDER